MEIENSRVDFKHKRNISMTRLKSNRGFWSALLLSIITLGFYRLYLLHAFAKETAIASEEEEKRMIGLALFILLSIVTLGIYSIVWECKWIKRCNEYLRINNKPEGLQVSTYLILFFLGLFISITFLVIFYKSLRLQNTVNRTYNELNNLQGTISFQSNSYRGSYSGYTAYDLQDWVQSRANDPHVCRTCGKYSSNGCGRDGSRRSPDDSCSQWD
jgi:magnesium-transporting ATPase (P-type)